MKSKHQKDQLFILIKSLTKAEKRNFRLYTNRLQGSGDTKFLQLFDALDKLQEYDETALLKRLGDVRKKQLPNLKRHLYKQILISLRLIYIQKNIDIQIREQIDFARILYTKGMYMQSLKMLERIKKIATEHHQDILHLEILEFQKLIEIRHITRSRSVENKMESLLQESEKRSEITLTTSKLSNLNIKIHGYYIQHGTVKTEKDVIAVQDFFKRHFPKDIPVSEQTFFENINLYQAYMWYNYILLNFEKCCEYCRQWVNLFQVSPQMKEKDPDLYMRGIYYLLTFLFFTKNKEEFDRYLENFEAFQELDKLQLNANSHSIAFIYYNLSRINGKILKQDYLGGIAMIPDIVKGLEAHKNYTDVHRVLLFYYKIAYLYFCSGQFEQALDYLNEIIHLKGGQLRNDLHFNSRLLHILCHYELNNYDLVDYLLPSLKRSFNLPDELGQAEIISMAFIQKIIKLPHQENKAVFQAFKKELKAIESSRFEKKSLVYLDMLVWVESHLQNCAIKDVALTE